MPASACFLNFAKSPRGQEVSSLFLESSLGLNFRSLLKKRQSFPGAQPGFLP
jgi:hypothetical protein